MQSIVTLFDILSQYGDAFSHDFWQMILSGVIKPLFDEIQFSFQSKKFSSKDKDLMVYKESCQQAFNRIIDIYNTYYDKLNYFTENLFGILLNCIQNSHEVLAKISVNALKYTINQSHKNFGPKEWELIIDLFSKICKNTTPVQLIDQQFINKSNEPKEKKVTSSFNLVISQTKKTLKFNSEECVTQCVVQLLMVSLIKEVIETHFDHFTDEVLLLFVIS